MINPRTTITTTPSFSHQQAPSPTGDEVPYLFIHVVFIQVVAPL